MDVALQTRDIVFREDDTLRVIIRRSKAHPFGMGRIAFSSKRSADLINAWLAWRRPDMAPLFCGIYRGKPINQPLGTTEAQDLLCAGFDTAAIMRAEVD